MEGDKMNTDIKIRTEGTRTYLEGIQPGFWEAGEMCEFASAFTCTLACVGEDVLYHYVLGVTGVAFRFTFGAELWNPGFYGFAGVAADVHDLVRRAFAAVGYGYHLHAKGDMADDLARIARSIANGVAVMLKGHVVDASDWVLITGSDGDVLLGTSPYSSGDKGERFKGYDVIREWHSKTVEYILLGEKGERPPAAGIYTDALRLAVDLVRTPQVADRITGLRAYEVLASALRGEEFTEDTLSWRYLCLLCYNMMLDDHRSATPFLKDAAGVLPRCAPDLIEAAGRYGRSCELRDRLEGILPSNFSEEAQKRLLDPTVRDEYARVILEIRDAEESAISCIERALAVGREQAKRTRQ
jgi:hypothetical protein